MIEVFYYKLCANYYLCSLFCNIS